MDRLLTLFSLALVMLVWFESKREQGAVDAWSPTTNARSHGPRYTKKGHQLLRADPLSSSMRSAGPFGSSSKHRAFPSLQLSKGFGGAESKSYSDFKSNKKNQKRARKKTAAEKQKICDVYSMPALYDLAFGYRDFEEEVSVLFARHFELTQRPVTSLLEVAAGPARHAVTALDLYHHRLGIDADTAPHALKAVHCVDLCPEMAAYAQETAREIFADEESLSCWHYQVDDMRNFTLTTTASAEIAAAEPVDTAWLLLGSLQHLTTNDDVIQCFQSIHRAVTDHGTLFLELPHPRETFAMVECTRNGWEVPLDFVFEKREDGDSMMNDDVHDDTESSSAAGKLKIVWGDDGDTFDPITQVRQFTVGFELITGEDDANIPPELQLGNLPKQKVRQVVPMRLFTAQEIDALARCAGWNVVAMYGALENGVAVDDEAGAFRLVCALQKE